METFKKRQKEMLRLEKQREKTARRLAKKRGTLHDPTIPDPDDENNIEGAETGEPVDGAEPSAAAAAGDAGPASKDGPA
jgi:hypothetical protein